LKETLRGLTAPRRRADPLRALKSVAGLQTANWINHRMPEDAARLRRQTGSNYPFAQEIVMAQRVHKWRVERAGMPPAAGPDDKE
jgi:hypothetical protein